MSLQHAQKHMQVHLPKIRRYKCEIGNCQKAYAWRSDLTRHQLDRHNILPHKCQYCKQKFRYFEEMKDHCNQVHFLEK
jgi:hypothetical protein